MKVIICNIRAKSQKKCINKDLAGGLGTGTWVGNSWRARFFEYVKKKNVVLPEISSAYLTAIFEANNWPVKFLEIKKSDDLLGQEAADLILMSTSIVDCHNELAVLKALKSQGYRVGVYGTFASAVPEFFVEHADFIIKGEPEAGVLEIIKSGVLPTGILAARPIENLDSLPFPDWRQFPREKYSYSPALNKRPMLPMLASRGCPYSCFYYCPYPINFGRQYRVRSVASVIGEMEYLKKSYGVAAIDFRDPIFTLDRERTRQLVRAMKQKDLKIIWSCETRIDCLDKELILEMQAAGLKHLNLGIESVSPDVLKGSRRLPAEINHQQEILAFCRKRGITVAAFYIIGLPDDTEVSVRQTIAYAKKLNTLVAQFAIATPYPGTDFFDKMKEAGELLDCDWEQYDEYTPVFRHKKLSPEKILSLKEKAFISYYFRPAYLLKNMPKYFKEKILWKFF